LEIGIGLPATIPGASGSLVLDWARRADSGPFSSLGVIDRLVYKNHEAIISLAAAVTERVRLMTTVLIAPVRDAALLAKQAATIDAFSGGRLTLGLGVGAREDDFRAASAPFEDRGRRFEEQLDLMKRVWSAEPVGDGIGEIGPQPAQPGGPEILIGAYAPAPLKRVGRWGDGFISGGIPDPPRCARCTTPRGSPGGPKGERAGHDSSRACTTRWVPTRSGAVTTSATTTRTSGAPRTTWRDRYRPPLRLSRVSSMASPTRAWTS
jgi:Luciferase-like monooxygenase